ncbi:hypothetical protein PFISCL1PPCAC_20603, partial [Pristionchus fissidentatus]
LNWPSISTLMSPLIFDLSADKEGVKELGRDFLNLFKRKKKKDANLQAKSPISPLQHLPQPSSSEPSTGREEHSDPVSFIGPPVIPHTPPPKSEITHHSANSPHGLHAVHSATSLTEMTSGGATSAESVDHDISFEENKKKEVMRAERRAHYRSTGVHVVADEDDHTEFEPTTHVWRVDRKIVNRLQWKDGVVPVDFDKGKPKKPRYVKRKEEPIDGDRVKPRSEIHILRLNEGLKDAVPLEEKKKSGRQDAVTLDDKTPKKKS